MAGMKIEAMIAARNAEIRAELERDLMAMIAAVDAELLPLERKAEQLEQRIRHFEQAGEPPS